MNANTPLPREMYAHKKFHIYFEGVNGLTAGEKLCSRPCFRKNHRKKTSTGWVGGGTIRQTDKKLP